MKKCSKDAARGMGGGEPPFFCRGAFLGECQRQERKCSICTFPALLTQPVHNRLTGAHKHDRKCANAKTQGRGWCFPQGSQAGEKGGGNFVAGDVDMHKCKCHGNTYANYFSHTLPHKNAPQSGRIRIPDTDTGTGTYYVHANGGGFGVAHLRICWL